MDARRVDRVEGMDLLQEAYANELVPFGENVQQRIGRRADLASAYVAPAAMHTMAATARAIPAACDRVTRSPRKTVARMTVVTG